LLRRMGLHTVIRLRRWKQLGDLSSVVSP